MRDIRLIALDLDGTLFDDQKQISNQNIETLNKVREKGTRIVIATGRSLTGVVALVKQLNLAEQDFLIVQNGAQIIRVGTYKVLKEHLINKVAMVELLNFIKPYKGMEAQVTAYNTDSLYLINSEIPNQQVVVDATILSCQIGYLSQAQLFERKDINKMVVLGLPEVLDQIEQAIPEELYTYFSPVRSQEEILEFLPKGISKASGLYELAEILGFSAEHVMAMGDQLNDLEMIEYARIGVAMANGHPIIKECADYITISNNESGVAHAIQHFLFE